jgi:DNA-binding response OmpR family regulator
MTQTARILLIDDDHDVIFGTSLRLRAAGYETMAAFDGEDGIAAAIDHHPDAIVLDIRMPRMDGMTALRRLREGDGTKDIPVVMLSASLVDQYAALDAGAKFFLTKPYQPRLLLAALESVMNEEGRDNGARQQLAAPSC